MPSAAHKGEGPPRVKGKMVIDIEITDKTTAIAAVSL
jgi:hypothetical protein